MGTRVLRYGGTGDSVEATEKRDTLSLVFSSSVVGNVAVVLEQKRMIHERITHNRCKGDVRFVCGSHQWDWV